MLIIDPLSEDSMPLIALAQSLYSHSAPLRVGFVFVTNYTSTVTGLTDAGVAVNNAYHYFADTKNTKEAVHFLAEVTILHSLHFRLVSISIRSKNINFYLS